MQVLEADICKQVWKSRYRLDGEVSIEDTWARVAKAVAAAEKADKRAYWEQEFYNLLAGFKFLPGGRILAGAGTGRNVTLLNCFVMDQMEGSIDGIFKSLTQSAVTMQFGGGIGVDFSHLRPKDISADASGRIASGPVSFMHIWDEMCSTILSTGARRGAMMATLRCDHPDIEEFITAKKTRPGSLTNFNLSVLVTDEFMHAVQMSLDWKLCFQGEVTRSISAGSLWHLIMESAYDSAEPGVLFIDRINRENNLYYRENISCTNPCGEVPLPPWGSCNLGSVNLTRFVKQSFTNEATFDHVEALRITEKAVRFLDNVIDITCYPFSEQRVCELGARRLGLGITGLADCLIMLHLNYGEEQALSFADDLMKQICHKAYQTSVQLAEEKGVFPFFKKNEYLAGSFIDRVLPQSMRDDIAKRGIRNSHLLSIAPAGTISILAGNISSGIEPIYDVSFERRVILKDGSRKTFVATDYAFQEWKKRFSKKSLPRYFVDAKSLTPEQHLDMQAEVSRHVDNAVSKTINVPKEYPLKDFIKIYDMAFKKGVKGCTVFRPNHFHSGVVTSSLGEKGPHCCNIDREAD